MVGHIGPYFLDMPPEVLLHILSYLDLPDLASLAKVTPLLDQLTSDPILHSYRIRIVSPARINHFLFGTSPQGHALRPTVADLVHRGVIRGLGIERRWRMGSYFYSKNSIVQYENGLRLSRRHASHILSLQLTRRSAEMNDVLFNTTYADVESAFPNVARSLLPVMRQLKWSLRRDQIAQLMKKGPCSVAGFASWFENSGRGIVEDSEKVRLALCPDVRKHVRFYETLAKS